MSTLQAIILGLIQGLSEFIPISSTAHLTIAGKLMGIIDPAHPERWTALIAVIQLGTLVAVLLYFKKELIEVPTAFLKENLGSRIKIREQSQNSKLGWMVIIGTIPIVVIGLALKHVIEGSLTKNLSVIGGSLIVLAIILAIAEKTSKLRKGMDDLSIKDGFLIGLAQCLALIPGASRSGTTITAGLFLGIKREDAARFSFLLSIPAVAASGLKEFFEAMKYLAPGDYLQLSIAIVVAGISGYISIAFLINYLKKHSTFLFIWYRVALGILLLGLIWQGVM